MGTYRYFSGGILKSSGRFPTSYPLQKSYSAVDGRGFFSKAARDVFKLMAANQSLALKVETARLVDSQVLSGNWTLMDCLQMQRIGVAANSIINWIGNYSNGLLVNSPVFDAYDGITVNGGLGNINTRYNPTVDGINVAQDDMQLGVWLVDSLTPAGGKRLWNDGVNIRINQTGTPDLQLKLNSSTMTVNFSGQGFLDGKLYSAKRVDSENQILIEDTTELSKAAVSTVLGNADIILGDNFNVKVACFYVCKAIGFDHNNWFNNLKIYMDNVAAF